MKVVEMEIKLGKTKPEELTGVKKLLYEQREKIRIEKEEKEKYLIENAGEIAYQRAKKDIDQEFD